MANQIQMRNGTLAQWQSANPVLLLGEIGYVSDKKYIVFGDGATAFTGLTPWSPTANVISLSGGGPYTITSAAGLQIFLINGSGNPYVINLPAAVGGGSEIKIFDASLLATGLVKIVPYSGDAIGQLAANAALYLQNVDQSGGSSVMQSLHLADVMAGRWSIEGGQFVASSTVDTLGSQYELGKLHHLPLGNATSRQLYSGAGPNASAWSAAIQATGNVGIPVGAKAIRIRVNYSGYAPAGSTACIWEHGYSDNNSNVPTILTAHPVTVGFSYAYIGSAVQLIGAYEVDIPLNNAGQFYIYCIVATNITIPSSGLSIAALGYYMGD
jgi:hypothetical protein